MDQSTQPKPPQSPTTVARKSDRELIVTRVFDSPVDAVFDAWSRAELFRVWWAPASMGAVVTACEIDARTGGGYRITFGQGPEAATFFGRYLEVAPSSRLVWTNEESGEGPVTTVTFAAHGPGTLLTLSELYPSPEPLADAIAGMQAMAGEQFAQLDELLASRRREAAGSEPA
ncbi:SRPBCC domain-containing protein [Phenylobacterium sp.]|uniref:SRPBCC domain-containing protein n=1 Tax=Phenylobacterium sp. TaxID=1871053 RepID=UPI0025F8AA2D|nr:SRPBCC domain-containing protein [Phenylobacterium sp.]